MISSEWVNKQLNKRSLHNWCVFCSLGRVDGRDPLNWCGDKYYELYYTVVMVSEHNETIVERYKDIENIFYSNDFSSDDLENIV